MGFQARGLKKQVVRPVSNSLQVREVVGEVNSPMEPNCSNSDRIIIFQPVVESFKGKWGSRRNVEQRRGTLPGVGHACGE